MTFQPANLDGYDGAIFACRPIRPGEWDEGRLKVWHAAVAAEGISIPTYDNAITEQCAKCGIDIQVGPNQQRQRSEIVSKGLPFTMLCIVDAVAEISDQVTENPESVTVHNLGNPQRF